jgi:parallel beta-helix repeat protein
MKNIITILVLIGLALLAAYAIFNLAVSAPSRNQSCPQNEICETVVPRDPPATGRSTLTAAVLTRVTPIRGGEPSVTGTPSLTATVLAKVTPTRGGEPIVTGTPTLTATVLASVTLARSEEPTVTSTPTLTASPTPGSQYYYVSLGGDDANAGTKALPFQTIGKAANVAQAGDVVLIQAGVYYEDVKPLNSGEPDNYITYQSEGDGEVIIDAQEGQRAGCIEINNKSYLQFIGLTVRGANSYETWPRAGISMTDGTHHILLDNITAYNNYVGIMAHGRDNPVSFITVQNSKTFGPGNIGNTHNGIFFYKKVYDSSIVNNHVAYTLPEAQSYGIDLSTDYPGSQSNGARRIVVTGNEVDHNESQGIHTWNAVGVLIGSNYLHDNGATGIQVEDGSENVVIENNLSENNAQKYEFETGTWVDDSKNVVVRNNILRNNEIGLTVTGSDRVIIHDNYFYFNNRGAQNLNNVAGLIVEDEATNISVTQNTFYKNGANGMQRGAVNFGLFHPTCTNITFKNNIVAETANVIDLFQDSCAGFVSDFNDFFNPRPLAIGWNQNQTDWLTYLAVSGQDAHSLTNDPFFVDPSTFNFSLQPASPLIASGAILARTISGGSGKTIIVTDASYFSDGFGIGSGDSVVIGDSLVNIVAIDYMNHSISVDRIIGWGKNDPVSFPFTGAAPDMGAGNMQR